MRKPTLLAAVAALFVPLLVSPEPAAARASSEKVVKETIVSRGKKRTYHLFVPETARAGAPAPLIVTLHGSGGNGLALVEKWKGLAKREGVIVAGPDSSDPAQWRVPEDGPELLFDLVEALKSRYAVNARRVYLFGHSAGAAQVFYMSLLESEYFAAVAAHAGLLHERAHPLMERVGRKMPIAIFVGTRDARLPLPLARATRDALNSRGFAAEYTEIAGHTHSYYDRADEINRAVWDFLKRHELMATPRYERYNFGG